MRTALSHGGGFAAVLLASTLAATQLSAQKEGNLPLDVVVQQRDPVRGHSFADPAVRTPEVKPSGTRSIVSADLLRHPIPEKVRRMLHKAWEAMNSADHEAAIEQLQETLAKYPRSAPYVHSLLGVEYLKTDKFAAAVSSFEQAVSLLPHDAWNHYNFGLSLACAGDLDRGEQEVRRAIALDPKNTSMQPLLSALLELKRHSVN